MTKTKEEARRDRSECSEWEDQKSFIGFYCDPPVKERVQLLAERNRQSVSETVRQMVHENAFSDRTG